MACAHRAPHRDAVRDVDIALAYLKTGQCDQAYARCQLAISYGTYFPHAHQCLGLVAMRCDGDMDKAAQHFKDALAEDEDFIAARVNLGITELNTVPPDLDAATALFESALAIHPRDRNARENLARTLLQRAHIETDEDEKSALLASAFHHALTLTEIEPLNPAGREILGAVRIQQGEFASAEGHLKRCVDSTDAPARCWFYLGYVQAESSACNESMTSFHHALRVPGGDALSFEIRREMRRVVNDCALDDEAIARALDALKKHPGDAPDHMLLAELYEKRGLLEHAAEQWRHALHLDPDQCEAHFQLAEHHSRILETETFVAHCHAYTQCKVTDAEHLAQCRRAIAPSLRFNDRSAGRSL